MASTATIAISSSPQSPHPCNFHAVDHRCGRTLGFDTYEVATGNRCDVNLDEVLYGMWKKCSTMTFSLGTNMFRRDLPFLSPTVNAIRCACGSAIEWHYVSSSITNLTLINLVLCAVQIALVLTQNWMADSNAVVATVIIPIACAFLCLEALNRLTISFHVRVAEYANTFFPHTTGVTLMQYWAKTMHNWYLLIRTAILFALSNVLIVANLVRTDQQRIALQIIVPIVFFGLGAAVSFVTNESRIQVEFWGSKVIAQIDDYFLQKLGQQPPVETAVTVWPLSEDANGPVSSLARSV